jgi:nicotinic acid phosphoribosyltransferase
MIRAITDNDLYKFSMANAVLRLFPNLKVGYRFTDRKGAWPLDRRRSA